jgi:hypothetical protein
MTAKVFALDTKPGVQRDGTVFDKEFYNSGRWVRFQRGRPRKIGGYRQITASLAGPSRGVYLNPQQNFNNVFNGYSGGLQLLPIDNNGVGSGITDLTLTNFTANADNLWQFDTFTDVSGSGNTLLLAHPGQNLTLIDNNINTPVLQGAITGTSLSAVGLFTSVAASVISGSPIVTFAATDTLIGAGQTVTGTGIPANTSVVSVTTSKETLASVAVTSPSGAFSCTSTAGLFVGQTVTVTGAVTTGTIVNPTILTTGGTFSCTSTIKLYVNQPVTVSGTLTPTALVNVQVTSVTGDLSFNTQTGIFVGQQIAVTGTLTGTATGIATNTTYFVVGSPTSTTLQLSATAGGAPLTTTPGTTTGLTFSAPLQTGIASGTTYFITTTNGTTTFTLSASIGGSAITTTVNSLAGLTFSAPLNIGLTVGDTYYITVTNGNSTFTLSATSGGSPVTTVTNVTTGLTFTTGNYYKVTLDQNATASGTSITLSFNNNVSVSGGVVALHPYVFVYGNNGLIRNCSASNINDWVSADANEVNVATGKIIQGLPVRGGSNAPSGLFWSLDSLIRVSYVGGTGTPPQYWRYDLISSQSSILSSQCVIEYDGIYYWCGVDRFMLYNGVVKEIPNAMNQNYFFDNLNYAQREKVWVSKVPRFGEIWWFYPRGSATECTDAIIYNIRENTWYDAGEALGAQRSAGYFSQVFHYPIASDWNVNATGGILTAAITNAGSAYTNGTYNSTPLTGGSGTGATANITVAGNVVTAVVINGHGTNYVVGNTLSASITGGSGFVLTVSTLMSFVSLYQNEIGTDKVTGATAVAIESYFETNDLGLVSGGPSQPSRVGENLGLRLERVEPDFVQTGDMELYVTGRPFAQSSDVTSLAYTFDSSTGKIDMREQRRELRLKFVSNVAGGDYQLGKVLLNADVGDVRPY